MKKTLILSFVSLVALVLAGCGPQKSQPTKAPRSSLPPADEMAKPQPATTNKPQDNASEELKGWNDYENSKHNYSLKYPPNWFFLKDNCCPPPPTFVNFNNVSENKAEFAAAQSTNGGSGSVGILCLYEADLNEIGEVQAFKDEGVKNELFEVNGYSGIKFIRQSAPGSNFNVLTHYLSNPEKESCRITFMDVCKDCEKILGTFKYSK